jgi:PAS domain S-box-containing protein
MLRKESLLGWSAVSDAFATFFALSPAPNDPAKRVAETARAKPASAQAPRAVAAPDTFTRAENSTRAVIGVVIVLIIATGILFALDFPVLVNAVRDSKGFSLDWRLFRIPAVVLVLILMEIMLVATLVLQDKRRHQLEILLGESEERMAIAAESADLGLWRWDADTDRFWATAHCRRMFGIKTGTVLDMAAMNEAVHPEDRAQVTDAIQNGVMTNSAFEVEYRLSIGDGLTRWVRIRGRPFVARDGNIARIAGTVVDITEKKKMQAEVERQQESLAHLSRVGIVGELSGALAHELNQPLTAILSNAQAMQRMIKRDPIDVAELKNVITDIINDDSRAGDVIRHLRALLKKDEARRETLDMNKVIAKALELTKSDLTSRRITVVANLTSQPLGLAGDPVQLQQLMLNLILNAAEAMASDPGHSGGALIIASDITGDLLHVSVADTGPGIRPEIMERLFEPFFSTKAQGLGLGLSISKAIVTSHGGTLWVENNAGRRGATFHVTMPKIRQGQA